MNDAVKYSICRACEQTSIIDEIIRKKPKHIDDVKKIVMTRLLKEEVSAKYLVKHG